MPESQPTVVESANAQTLALLARTDVAALLRVSVRTVDRLIAAGELPSVCVRRARRIPVAAVQQMLATRAS